MDTHSELHAVLAELRTSAERAEAALSKVQLRTDPRIMPPPGMLAAFSLAALPATFVSRALRARRDQGASPGSRTPRGVVHPGGRA
ncbi:hypothetical protein C8N35_10586 [Breoghania corrubedonensis]|uniref:Uncharacterized protein n=1 Tax=Breoghania corrubedonensis TaxID=665038 RepID=A0A2T5V8K0_9HYPH|nr:hypothetical protein [Breoghania corrubedonensis]PTW60086.1 hypothetical protein C8N35_10586 [Breoghania corrubedonensis]